MTAGVGDSNAAGTGGWAGEAKTEQGQPGVWVTGGTDWAAM